MSSFYATTAVTASEIARHSRHEPEFLLDLLGDLAEEAAQNSAVPGMIGREADGSRHHQRIPAFLRRLAEGIEHGNQSD